MTPLQESIIDRLMAAKITRDWSGGPMHVAATVIDPPFELPEGKYHRRQMVLSRLLGYSRLFCEAFHGANAGLAQEDDRRKLSIAVFSALSPLAKPRKIRAALAREVVTWMAFRAHELACPGKCDLRDHMRASVTESTAGKPGIAWLNWNQAMFSIPGVRCASWQGEPQGGRVSVNCPAVQCSVIAFKYLCPALRDKSPTVPSAETARESARTEAKVRGADGAAELLIELAARLKL